MSFLKTTPVSSPAAAWSVVTTLLAEVVPGSCPGAGRYVRTSANGTTYTLVGNVLDSSSVLVPGAWLVLGLRLFSDGLSYVRRELAIQFDGSGGLRVKYSPRAGFVLGTPGVVRTPAAADEVYLLGGGTDASPTYSTLFPSSGFRLVGYASETDDSFWFGTYPVGGGAFSSLLYLDDLPNPPRSTGGYLLDKDPAVLYAASGSTSALEDSLSSESTGPRGVLAYGDLETVPRTLWARVPALSASVLDTSGVRRRVYPAGGTSSIAFAGIPEGRLRYVRRAALSGTTLPGEVGNVATTDEKGFGGLLRWTATLASVPTLRDSVDLLTGNVLRGASLAIGHVALPWDGSDPDL